MAILTPTINSQLACDGNLNNTQKCKKFNCGDGVVKTITFKSYLLTFKYVLILLQNSLISYHNIYFGALFKHNQLNVYDTNRNQ